MVDRSILREHLKEKVVSLAVTFSVKHSATKFSVKPSLVIRWVKQAGLEEKLTQPRDERSLYTVRQVTASDQINDDQHATLSTTNDHALQVKDTAHEKIDIQKLFAGAKIAMQLRKMKTTY